jgi:hypothetical protein
VSDTAYVLWVLGALVALWLADRFDRRHHLPDDEDRS